MKQRVIRFLEKQFYKGLSLMLTLALVFTMIPTFVIPANAADNVFDISNGDITIAAGLENTVKVTYGTPNVTTDEFNNTQEITITGKTTANKVVVATGVTAKITLNNVDIQLSNGCAFDIQGNSNVELTLEGTTNMLKSSGDFAGLQVQEKAGNVATVTIQGTGTLNVIGGGHGSNDGTGAGIGGGLSGSGGNITINSGTVIAKGGGNGAGIGGGDNGAGGNITISGGTVTAINTIKTTEGLRGGAAAIGGGWHATSGNITISGGTVTAESTWEGAAIGGGEQVCDNITISGGIVTAIGGAGAGIGSGKGAAGGTIAISGNANVTATGKWGGAGIGGGSGSGNGGTIKIDNTATVIAVSNGTKNAISGSDNAIEAEGGTVANVLIANYVVAVTTETKVKNGSGGDLTPPISYVPVGYKSIAFTVPSTGDYMIYNGGVKQQGNKGVTTSSTFSVKAGLNTFSSVTEVVGEVVVTAISVNGTGDATQITKNGGTLQMEAVITPSNATNKEVTWTVEDGTGSAMISTTGILTATKNGAVTVKATAKDGSLVVGSKEITISGQVVTMTGIVTIEGSAKFGQTLTATPNLTNGGEFTYQWYRDGVAIGGATGGATGTTYELVEADISKKITVTATADGTSGTGSITSEATAAIVKADGPSLAGVTISDATNTATGMTAGMEFSTDGTNWTTYNAETPNLPNLTQAVALQVRVKATATNEAGAATTFNFTIPTLSSIAITTSATKLAYKVGDTLDIAGMVVTGTYSDGTTKAETITGTDVTGFNSSAVVGSQTLTVTVSEKTTTYTISVVKVDAVAPPAPVMVSKTHTSVTLTANDLYEYSKDNGATWQDSGVFTGLNPSTTYTFVARVKGTSTTNESVAGTGTSITTGSTPYIPPTPTEPEPRPEPIPNTDNKKEQIIVDINDGKSDKSVSEITVERETAKDGTKKDTVKYEENKAKETVAKLKEEGKDTARIVIPDKKDEITETKVDIPKNTLNVLGEGNINLEISTENARISLPKETIKDLSKGNIDNLYFRVVPIKKEEQKNEVTERIKQSSVVMQVAGDNNISVAVRPMIIETNMSQKPVDIILPLKDVVIPTDPKEKEEFLKKLAVYIEHNDGEKELIRGGIVEYKDGVLGIKFRITKFSTFTIIKIDTPAKSKACEVTNWTKPTQLTVNGTTVTKAVGNEVTSITVEVTVSDKATYKLYSDETCTKELTDKIMKLNVGENEAYIKVTAEDGTQKIYKVQINRAKVSDTKNVPQITFVGVEHSPLIVGETQSFYITSKSDNKVQYRMFLHNDTNKTKEELTSGYTELVRPDFPYVIAPDHKFTLGKYRVEIWVKQEGSNNQYDSTYTAYLNCVNKDDKNRVYTNGDLMIEKDTYTVGEKVVISGIEDIGGLTGPYYYRLHILRPDQIGKDGENSNGWYYYVTDYKSAIEWTPQEPGTYIMDVHVITPNSILWKNKDRKSKLIYGTYEGWKLKTIIVNEKPTNNDPVNKK